MHDFTKSTEAPVDVNQSMPLVVSCTEVENSVQIDMNYMDKFDSWVELYEKNPG